MRRPGANERVALQGKEDSLVLIILALIPSVACAVHLNACIYFLPRPHPLSCPPPSPTALAKGGRNPTTGKKMEADVAPTRELLMLLLSARRYEMLPEVKLLREAQRRRQEIVERRVKAMQVWMAASLLSD